jgi:hypothetical protein
MSNSKLQQQIADESPAVQDEVLHINTSAQHHALQIALLIPLASALLGLGVSFRMIHLPDPVSSGAGEGMVLG